MVTENLSGFYITFLKSFTKTLLYSVSSNRPIFCFENIWRFPFYLTLR